MNFTWVVNRVSTHPRPVEVDWKGDKAVMQLAETEVEMVDPTGVHGSVTLHFSGKAEMEHASKFSTGATVSLNMDAFVVSADGAEESAA